MSVLLSITQRPYDEVGDFYKLMLREPQNVLFLYQDSVEQFLDKNDVTPGDGAKMMRMYRLDNMRSDHTRAGSLPIPTRFVKRSVAKDERSFRALLGHVRAAIGNVKRYLDSHPEISTVVWSADDMMMIGTLESVLQGYMSAAQAIELQNLLQAEMLEVVYERRMEIRSYGSGIADDTSATHVARLLRLRN